MQICIIRNAKKQKSGSFRMKPGASALFLFVRRDWKCWNWGIQPGEWILGSGEEEAVDAALRMTSTGKYVTIVEDGRIWHLGKYYVAEEQEDTWTHGKTRWFTISPQKIGILWKRKSLWKTSCKDTHSPVSAYSILQLNMIQIQKYEESCRWMIWEIIVVC